MQSMVCVLLELLVVAWLTIVNMVYAYPGGPPLSACTNMRPTGHGASTLSGATPFTISTNTTFYTPGEKIEVTISGAQFIGFFVQARRRDSGSDMSTAVGTLTPGNSAIGKALNCGGGTDNAWSHKTNAPKTSESAIWTAPSDDQGTLAFRATIVQGPSSDKYWTDVYSANLPFGAPAEDSTDSGVSEDNMPTPSPTSSGGIYTSSLLLLLVCFVIAAMNPF